MIGDNMNIKVYLLGDKIPKHFLSAIQEYDKRLSKYCKIKLIEPKNEDALIKALSETSYKILIDTKGVNPSSTELAEKITTLANTGRSDLEIIYGLNTIQADETLAISKMDMDSSLLITVLYEQIYRAFRIIHNHSYHK